MSIPVVTIGADGTGLVGDLERLHGPVTVVRRCSELTELVAACQSGLARVAVVVGATADVTATLVDRLAEVGVALVGLTDDDGELRRLGSLGVRSAPEGVEAEALAELIAEASRRAGEGRERGGGPTSSFSLPGAHNVREPSAAPSAFFEAPPGGAPRGSLVAVWGPIGSPGRTTIAVNIAAELVAVGERVVLVDADTYGPSVAVHLGLLDESAGIAQACRLADHGTLDAEALGRVVAHVVTTAGTLLVLTGLTRADRWPELRGASFAAVLDRCREIADTVVVDVGFSLEADEELSFDTMAPRRNAATHRALESADRIVAVGAADAVGVPRLVRGVSELERAVPSARPDIVFNKVRRGSLGRFPERALRDAWERFGPDRPLAALVPHAADVADAALLDGGLLLESAPQSALRLAIAGIVCSPVQQNRKSAVASARALSKRSR